MPGWDFQGGFTREAVALAMKTGLTGYDASYLWLAQTAGAQLLTLDGMLLKNLT